MRAIDECKYAIEETSRKIVKCNDAKELALLERELKAHISALEGWRRILRDTQDAYHTSNDLSEEE